MNYKNIKENAEMTLQIESLRYANNPQLALILQTACMEAGILPPDLDTLVSPHARRLSEENKSIDKFLASMTDEEARECKRKFRKMWRARIRRFKACRSHMKFGNENKWDPRRSFIDQVIKRKDNPKVNGVGSIREQRQLAYAEVLQRYVEAHPDIELPIGKS